MNNHTVSAFAKGDRVCFTAGYHEGTLATVVRPVKSRGVVHVEIDGDEAANYRQWDAYPHTLVKITDPEGLK